MTDVRIAQRTERVVVGVDTHADLHVAAALDPLGRMLGHLEVGTSTRGYAQLLKWAHTFSPTTTFGVEGKLARDPACEDIALIPDACEVAVDLAVRRVARSLS